MADQIEDHIQFRRIRPRIHTETSISVDELSKAFKTNLSDKKYGCEGKVVHGFATIYPPEEEQHFWSPQLTLSFEESDNGTLIRGLYGPQPTVWTMFVFFYTIVGFAILILGMLGYSYWTLDKPVTFLWAVPVFIALFLSLFLVAYFGQKLGQKQMTRLHRFLENCLGKDVEAN